jgi:hypothetical protein
MLRDIGLALKWNNVFEIAFNKFQEIPKKTQKTPSYLGTRTAILVPEVVAA